MKVFRAEVHGHRLELRVGDFGGQQLLLDGRIVSEQPYAGLTGKSHFLDVPDEDGRQRHVEVQLIDVSKWKIGRYRCVVRVDGIERCRAEPTDPASAPDVCPHCGHQVKGVPAVNGEVRCPECGRHTPAVGLGRGEQE
jgi:hypothetical protein